MTTELKSMQRLRGQDFYDADPSFKQLIKPLMPSKDWSGVEKKLKAFSAQVSDQWDSWAEEAALAYEGPWIESYDAMGHPVDRVCLPPPTQKIRRDVVRAGIFENGSQVEQFAKVYLLAHLGESGVVCPLACTEGLIRAIRAVGSDFLKEHYLPQLLSWERPLAGAQFITEQDMGSDVGAMKTTAVYEAEGQWRLHGEKWFCSAIDEFFLVGARPDGAAAGTSGVAVFLVPRSLDGQLNGIRIKRLKNKVGTKELPTAEIELSGAIGYNIGPVESGFKTLMNYVLNTSRIMNAASGLGMISRAALEAENYARQRSAFGQKIIEFPLVQASLKRIRSILTTRRAVYFNMLSRIDTQPVTDFASDEAYWQRFLINLCKYRTAIGATEAVHEAILQLGGNGTVESFSILPRLYRDSLVIETWEGTHNTLCLQICRDATRFPFKDFLKEELKESFKEISADLKSLEDPKWVMVNARDFVDRVATLLELKYEN